MINKDNLKNKYITYIDKHERTRTSKVVRIAGNTLSVKRADGVVERVYKDKVLGRQFRKTGMEDIQWRIK